MTETRELPVEQSGRLDHFLRRALPQLSRRNLREILAHRRVLLNGRVARKGDLVRVGDSVTIDAELTATTTLRAQPELAISIVWQDQAVVAIDKPCGIPSVALAITEVGTAANFLIAHFPETAHLGGRGLEAGFVHRLDTATSGLLLAARSPAAYRSLRDQFRSHAVTKIYRAVVAGGVAEAGVISTSVRTKPGDRTRVEVADAGVPGGRSAETRYRPLASTAARTLLEIEIRSGTRHQIRAHLASVGHPIVGDELYGGDAAGRLMLHACEIAFDHPITGKRTSITQAPPAAFAPAMKERETG